MELSLTPLEPIQPLQREHNNAHILSLDEIALNSVGVVDNKWIT